MDISKNLFQIDSLPIGKEEFEELLCQKGDVKIQRIVSTGQASPPGFFYDQEQNEWVALLQGEAQLSIEGNIIHLRPGDSILIAAHQKHRVEMTSQNPPCIWLCVYL